MRIFMGTLGIILVMSLTPNADAARSLEPQSRSEIESIRNLTGKLPQVVSVRMDGKPSLMLGTLSAPLAKTATSAALTFVKNHASLFATTVENVTVLKEIPHPLGKTVRLQQTKDGVPVVGAHLAIVVDRDGVVRTVSNSLVDVSDVDTVPEVADFDAAMTALENARWFIPSNTHGFLSRLVIIPLPGSSGKLAWELHFGAVPGLLSNMWIYVDAKTGEVLKQENRIQMYKGLAYETNPGPTGDRKDPIEVELDIPEGGFEYTADNYDKEMIEAVKTACDFEEGAEDCPEGAAVWLRHPLYLAQNCPDYHQLIDLDLSMMGLGKIKAHFCTEAQTAHADDDGQFYFDDWKDENGEFWDRGLNDKFAEVQMFYHVGQAYDFFLTLMDDYEGSSGVADWQGHAMAPMMATVNFKIPLNMSSFSGGMPDITKIFQEVSDPNGELYPFDNAFFMPGSQSMGLPGLSKPHDSIVFGQGTLADFSWDGDVIYHEFTHSVDNSVNNGGTVQYNDFADEWGINPEPGGLSEGYADTFPAFMTNEPTMGEYSLATFGDANVRDLAGDDICPNALQGEVHADSPVWSQSNYQAREAAVNAVAGEMDVETARHKFAQATFIGLSSVVGEQGFAETAAATLEAVKELMGENAHAAAAEVYAAKNTDDCARIMSDGGTGKIEREYPIAAPEAIRMFIQGDPYTPGIIQYEMNVNPGDKVINFSATMSAGMGGGSMIPGMGGEADVQMIVRKDEPIQFKYQAGKVKTDDDVIGPLTLDDAGRFSLEGNLEDGSLPEGKYYLMPVNAGAARGNMLFLEVEIAAETTAGDKGVHLYPEQGVDPEDTDTTDLGTDEDDGTDTPGGTDTVDDGDDSDVIEEEGDQDTKDDDSGCGCSNVSAKSSNVSLLGLLGSLLIS